MSDPSFLLNGFLEELASAELGLSGAVDLERLTGPRIATHGSLAPGHDEVAKADQTNLITAAKRVGDDLKHRLNRS
jgi:hypothetical protein